jgi:hypothetical protein
MRPAIEGRTIALAGRTAESVVGAPIDAREDNGLLVLKRANSLGGPTVGTARTFLGFDEGHVATCIVVCASATESTRPCDATVKSARLEGGGPAPPPGIGLGAITWAVHHPRPTAGFGALLLVGSAVLAILWRRRPRFRAR